MQYHVAVIHHHPAVAGIAGFASLLAVVFADAFHHAVCQRIQHAVAGAGADDEVIGKLDDLLQVEQYDVLAFFIFQSVDDGAGKFECVQVSPHDKRQNGLWVAEVGSKAWRLVFLQRRGEKTGIYRACGL